jgi:hypothetical protein
MAQQRPAKSKAAAKPAKPERKAPAKTQAPEQKPAPAKTFAASLPAVAGAYQVVKSGAPMAGDLRSVEAGPGLLLGAMVTMHGAAAGVSQIGLEIDGTLIQVCRADQLTARGLVTPNAIGAWAAHHSYGNVWTVVFGWPYPVRATSGVKLSVQVLEPVAELELVLQVAR